MKNFTVATSIKYMWMRVVSLCLSQQAPPIPYKSINTERECTQGSGWIIYYIAQIKGICSNKFLKFNFQYTNVNFTEVILLIPDDYDIFLNHHTIIPNWFLLQLNANLRRAKSYAAAKVPRWRAWKISTGNLSSVTTIQILWLYVKNLQKNKNIKANEEGEADRWWQWTPTISHT